MFHCGSRCRPTPLSPHALRAARPGEPHPHPSILPQTQDHYILRPFDWLLLAPHNLVAYYHNRGLTYYDQRDHEDAIDDYCEATSIDPEYAEAFYGRGLAYYDYSECELAIADLTMAIDIDPNNMWAYYYRGFAYCGLDEEERATADFQSYSRQAPRHAELWRTRRWNVSTRSKASNSHIRASAILLA